MITVVGKGPSLKGKKLGNIIDNYDFVVRTAGSKLDDDYGYKTDYLIVTTLAIHELKQSNLDGVQEIWIYKTRPTFKNILDSNSWDDYLLWPEKELGFTGKVRFISVDEWVMKYKLQAKQMYSLNVHYPSKGTVAVIEAIAVLPYSHITIMGFDYITGKTEDVPWTKHDFKTEKMLIDEAAQLYNKKVGVL